MILSVRMCVKGLGLIWICALYKFKFIIIIIIIINIIIIIVIIILLPLINIIIIFIECVAKDMRLWYTMKCCKGVAHLRRSTKYLRTHKAALKILFLEMAKDLVYICYQLVTCSLVCLHKPVKISTATTAAAATTPQIFPTFLFSIISETLNLNFTKLESHAHGKHIKPKTICVSV